VTRSVVVAGAGVIGSTIAWRLAQSGCAVTLVDAGAMGGEASWAGAGMLCAGVECAGSPWGARFVESLSMYGGFVEELARVSKEAIDYRVAGGIELAATDEDMAALRACLPGLAALGVRARLVDRDDLARLAPPLNRSRFAGGLYIEGEAQVDPRDLMRALRAACLSAGVRIREHCRVTRVDRRGAGVVVSTDHGELAADAAVVGAGAWSGAVAAPHRLPESFPVKGHLAAFEAPSGVLGPLLRHGHTYVFQRNRGTVIAGSNEELAGFDRSVNPAAVDDIVARARRLTPALLAAEPVDRWSGLRPATGLPGPVVERLGDLPVWLAYGHYRNGILLAPFTARLVAGEIISI
jgi:glycine oxidase